MTIDCARQDPVGKLGMKDEHWWLHLYVMFSRVTCMEDMLLLRPHPRTLLEAGPPAHVRRALERFEQQVASSTEAAVLLAAQYGIPVPPLVSELAGRVAPRALMCSGSIVAIGSQRKFVSIA